jgi:hypothetical protein
VTVAPASFARRSATASISAEASTPVTIAPRFASAIAARPVPVPTSRMRRPSTGARNAAMRSSCVSAMRRPIGPLKRIASKRSAIAGSAYTSYE